jgi:hypothetical protein
MTLSRSIETVRFVKVVERADLTVRPTRLGRSLLRPRAITLLDYRGLAFGSEATASMRGSAVS